MTGTGFERPSGAGWLQRLRMSWYLRKAMRAASRGNWNVALVHLDKHDAARDAHL